MAKRSNEVINLGGRYGAFTVIDKCGGGWWSCRCDDCGQRSLLKARQLVEGYDACQHCAGRSAYRDYPKEYSIWASMKQRCDNSRSHAYKHYGGKGIRVCDEWSDSFEQFIEDMGPRPSSEHALTRINRDGDYTPDNCRWAKNCHQLARARDKQQLSLNGRTQSLDEWAGEIGISSSALRYRLRRWGKERALTEPPNQKGRRKHNS